MRRKIIAANWKMNKNSTNAAELASSVRQAIESKRLDEKVDVVLCPPFVAFHHVGDAIRGSSLTLGAQNMHFESDGAFTGEISVAMLTAAGVRFVILGHSERRTYFGETDAIINKKIKQALAFELLPIVCIGETLAEREAGETFEVIERQTRGVLSEITSEQLSSIVIAYEPVWAIGTGRNATPEQAQEVHTFIRSLVGRLYTQSDATNLRIQYGGSMKAENAGELLAQPDIDGGLIGGASLVAAQFVGIVEAAFMNSETIH